MGYNFSGLTFGPKGMIIQQSLGFLPENAFLTHPNGDGLFDNENNLGIEGLGHPPVCELPSLHKTAE